MRNRHHLAASLLAALLVAAAAAPADAARIKDVASIRGVRSNQLVGYGIVVGLDGTGDDQQVYFTLRSVQLMLQRLGVPAAQKSVFDLRNLRLRNTAAVMVTANLPPFARAGSRIDVTVSALGNAKSLQGGTLLMTPLRGVDLKVYALAQGQLTTGGFGASGRTGSRVQKGHRNVARVPRGAIVEREVPSQFVHNKKIVIALRRPDFTTASRVVQVVNRAIGNGAARSSDPATVVVTVPDKDAADTVTLISKVETLVVTPDAPARVIINERTGTVVVGRDVQLSPVAIAHGNLTLEINERFRVSQPRAPSFSRTPGARTRVVPETTVKAREGSGQFRLVKRAASLSDVVKALNALGASPRDLVAIFQALEAAGALPAKLVVQ